MLPLSISWSPPRLGPKEIFFSLSIFLHLVKRTFEPIGTASGLRFWVLGQRGGTFLQTSMAGPPTHSPPSLPRWSVAYIQPSVHTSLAFYVNSSNHQEFKIQNISSTVGSFAPFPSQNPTKCHHSSDFQPHWPLLSDYKFHLNRVIQYVFLCVSGFFCSKYLLIPVLLYKQFDNFSLFLRNVYHHGFI